MKVLLILVDGMRPDALEDIPQAQAMLKTSSYSLTAQTVFPSVTLPCHMSLFHSVGPERHGTTTNTYAPQVRPIDGLCEQMAQAGKSCALFYNWEQLRDLSRPDSLAYSCFCAGKAIGYPASNRKVTEEAMEYISGYAPDFVFLYLGWLDEAGHESGWMGEEYQHACQESWKEIERITKTLPEDYIVIVTSDHGGHERSHGTELPEDMTIPVILHGSPFEAGKELLNVNIKDIAPTIANLLDAPIAKQWEGRSLADGKSC